MQLEGGSACDMCHVTEQPLHDGTSLHMSTCHVLGTIVILIFCVAARKRPIAFPAPHHIVHHTSAPGIVNMMRKAGLVLLIAAALTFSADVLAASAPAPAPALTATVSTVATSVNTTGSLGSLCSSQTGLLSLLQGATANSTLLGYSDSLANLNITIPTNLSNANALQEIAQVSANYIEPHAAADPLYRFCAQQ